VEIFRKLHVIEEQGQGEEGHIEILRLGMTYIFGVVKGMICRFVVMESQSEPAFFYVSYVKNKLKVL
jgi:hypothetical protein